MTLCVVVITKNEARVIARCLESVAWTDEIIVLDSASTDGTPDIARKLQAKVTTRNDWPGFGAQKNRALDLARGDWVLSLDADEWVTPELRAQMEHECREHQIAGPADNRKQHIMRGDNSERDKYNTPQASRRMAREKRKHECAESNQKCVRD